MARQVDGAALAAVFAGSLLTYAGLTGKSIPKALQAIVQGKSPATAPATEGIPGLPGSVFKVAGPNPTGNAIADDALSYVGKIGYSWDGSMNSGAPDCSGFVNGVLGRDMGLAIPGFAAGTFDGSQHGPSSFAYPLWGGAQAISRSQVAAGDILVWLGGVGHIGIAISNDQMVSDLDPTDAVKVTGIEGTATGGLVCLRLKNTASGTSSGGTKR